MNLDVEKIREKLLDAINPNSDYSLEDFNLEFNGEIPINQDNFKFNLKLKNESSNIKPDYATEGSSGFDLRANLTEKITLKTGERAIVPTGLFFEIPVGYEIQIRPRSGLAAKNGVTVLNTPGTIDADYRGEIKIILINFGADDFEINHGDRIAQGVFASVIGSKFIVIEEVGKINNDTKRGEGGFGSTGHQ